MNLHIGPKSHRLAYNQGEVVYQAIPAPPGAIITTLPAGCTVQMRDGVSYQYWGSTYYMRVSTGYQVVVF
jgi:Family of unknown function (DUF6515)